MEKSTQTNRTYIEYISFYDKPKTGRPAGSKYTDEEKAERARLSAMRHYSNNIEKRKRDKHIRVSWKRNCLK